MDLQTGEGLHLALLVGGGAHVRPRILLGDARHRQYVQHLETLGWELFTQLEASRGETQRHKVWAQQKVEGQCLKLSVFQGALELLYLKSESAQRQFEKQMLQFVA